MEKKNILVVASTFPSFAPGDASPPFVYELSRRLAGCFDVFVLAPHSRGAKSFETKEGINIYRYKYWPGKRKLADGAILPNLKKRPWLFLQIPFFLFFQLVYVRKLCRRFDISLIHAHWIIPQGFIATLYKWFFFSSIPVLCTTHGADIFGLKGMLGIWLKKTGLLGVNRITVVSQAIKRELASMTTKEILVLPMGVDTEEFTPEKASVALRESLNPVGPVLLFVGRLSEKKGIRYLLQAMPDIISRHPSVKLIIVGEGEERPEVEKMILTLGLKDFVELKGWLQQKDLAVYFATADLFIGPSVQVSNGDREGFGLTFAEALSSQCAVIATDLPAISDIIKDHETGFVVQQRSASSIAEKVNLLLSNPKILAQVKTSGRAHVLNHFDWGVITRAYAGVINEMLGNRPKCESRSSPL